MKRPVRTAMFLSAIAAVMLVTGCEKENLSNTKKYRLMAAENIQLKKELEEQKKLLEQQSPKSIEDIVNAAFKDIAEEHEQLVKENTELKAQLEQLKKESDTNSLQPGPQ